MQALNRRLGRILVTQDQSFRKDHGPPVDEDLDFTWYTA